MTGADPAIGEWRAGALTEQEFSARVAPLIDGLVLLAARLTSWGQAEDIVQDALTRAWRKRAQFDESRGTLRSWLLAITADQARQEHRRLASRARRLRPVAVPEAAPEPDRELELLVDELPPRQRLAVWCFYFADLSVKETAVVMKCSEGTVKSTLSDGRKRLRTLLEGAEQ